MQQENMHTFKNVIFLTLIIKWLVRNWVNDQYIKKKLKKNSFKKFVIWKIDLATKWYHKCLALVMSLPLMNAFLLSTLCENLMGLQGMEVAWCQPTFISFNLSITSMHTTMDDQLFLFFLCFCMVFNNS
jgi:hypothetical protein